jgi:signal transduction histidine kinase
MSGDDHAGLGPISAGFSAALHLLVGALGLVVVLSAAGEEAGQSAAVIGGTAVFVATYCVGIWPSWTIPERGRRAGWWIAVLTLEWGVLLWFSVEATYLVFALFFLYMRLLGGIWGTVVVAVTTVVAVVAFGLHRGFDLAGVIGPVLGAGVAITISVGFQALSHEVHKRQQLVEELTRTRSQLAVAERAAGVVDERERLAREIHDTVSQSLSSIIMLLHAAQRSGADSAGGRERVEQARNAAEDALAETRELIDALAPASLRAGGIVEALDRLARRTADATGLHVELTVPQDVGALSTPVQVGLLRIAQSALANAAQHARATRVDVTLTRLDDEVILDVVDDGEGFDLGRLATDPGDRPSFGLVAMEERAESLGGDLVVESSPGRGTSVVASFSVSS